MYLNLKNTSLIYGKGKKAALNIIDFVKTRHVLHRKKTKVATFNSRISCKTNALTLHKRYRYYIQSISNIDVHFGRIIHSYV